MKKRFPDFKLTIESNMLIWVGPLRPIQKQYVVSLFWCAENFELPYVLLEDPILMPRTGCDYEDIPHLLYNRDDPARSGLCLFDPDQKEWNPRYDYIAKTTIPWVAKWLANYEYWHLTGVWIGEGVLPATVREISLNDNITKDNVA